MNNRIAEFRKARNWSMRELAQRVNSSPSTINAIEKGKTQLNLAWLHRLAKVFDVSVEELAGFSQEKPQYIESTEDDVDLIDPNNYELSFPHDRDILRISHVILNNNQALYEVRTSALDQIGMHIGSIVIVDGSLDLIRSLQMGDIVVGRYSCDKKETLIIRQFIASDLLLANSSTSNYPSINLRSETFKIEGIVIWSMLPVLRKRRKIDAD